MITSDGKWDRPVGYNSSTDGLGSNFWCGRMDAFEPTWVDDWPGKQGIYAELNSFAKEYVLEKFSFDNTKVAAEMAAMGDICATYIPSIHFGKTGNPDKAVADFRAALKSAGFDKVKTEIQTQLTAFKAAN